MPKLTLPISHPQSPQPTQINKYTDSPILQTKNQNQSRESIKMTESNMKLTDNAKASSSFRLRSPSLNSLRLRRIFDLFDKNGDNMISVQELSQALNLLGLENDLSELDSTVNSFIKDGNSGLEFDDFVALHQSLSDSLFGSPDSYDDAMAEEAAAAKNQEESDLSEAFKVFDEDGDGFISAQELQTVLCKLGFQESQELDRVQKMIGSFDRNQDGRVDFFEFKDMMRGVMVKSS